MDNGHREEISRRLRPVAAPRVIDGVLRDEQVRAVLGLIRAHGPWDLIIKHHFSSLEELVATTSGGRPLPPGTTLDSFVTPVFRGFFANGGVCFYPEAESLFYDSRLLAWARDYFGAQVCAAHEDPVQRGRADARTATPATSTLRASGAWGS